MYKTRHILLGLEDDPIKAEIPDTYIIRFSASDVNNEDGDKTSAFSHNSNNIHSNGLFSEYLFYFGYVFVYFCILLACL